LPLLFVSFNETISRFLVRSDIFKIQTLNKYPSAIGTVLYQNTNQGFKPLKELLALELLLVDLCGR